MLALFITLSAALSLLVWGEIGSARPAAMTVAQPQMPAPGPLRRPGRKADPQPPQPLLRLTDFTPGDLIELELPGALPRADDIHFVPLPGGDTRVQIAGEDVLILAGVDATILSPDIFRLRRLSAA